LTAASPPANCAAPQQKQLYWYSSYGGIEVRELVFTQAKGMPFLRTFSQGAAVSCLGYSRPLQRILLIWVQLKLAGY